MGKLVVIKRANIDYDQYWNEKTGKFGSLISATKYGEDNVPTVEGGVAVDFAKLLERDKDRW